MIALISVLSYHDVQLSVMVLGVALILEVVILVIFDLGAILSDTQPSIRGSQRPQRQHASCRTEGGRCGHRGRRSCGRHLHGLLVLGRLRDGANYAEESRDPKRIIRAHSTTRSSGSGSSTSSRAGARFLLPDQGDMLAKAVKDFGQFLPDADRQNVGHWAEELMSVLILTSSFACGMAFHNTAARYAYSLGREGVFLRFLGRRIPRSRARTSPHGAVVLALVWVGFSPTS